MGWLVASVAAATLLGGCDYRQLQQDRAALMRQNQELQAQNSAMMDENDRVARQPAPAPMAVPPPAPMPMPPAFEPAGFESIQGLEIDDSGPTEVKLSVPGDLLFGPGSATLTQEARKTVSQVAAVLNGKHAGSTVGVIGHTDSDPITKSKWASNEALSLARAQAVADQLSSVGRVPRPAGDARRRGAAAPGRQEVGRPPRRDRRLEVSGRP